MEQSFPILAGLSPKSSQMGVGVGLCRPKSGILQKRFFRNGKPWVLPRP